MARLFPSEVPPAPDAAEAAESETRVFSIEFITPLFGGGVEPKRADPITVVRGASIRGQLRFWWRATRGRGFTSVKELCEQERQIWGNTKEASHVRIGVVIRGGGTAIGPDATKCPQYALFPFDHSDRENALRGISFDLSLTFPIALKQDVEAAVWAWTNFGGLGSRTRRGCGALHCKATAPEAAASITDWWNKQIQARCAQWARQAAEPSWPVLGELLMFKAPSRDNEPWAAWNDGIVALAEFRQKEEFARNKGRYRIAKVGRRTGESVYAPGRSRWPEAESLKAHTGESAPEHSDAVIEGPDLKEDPAFPRAALGLPIVFQFRPDPEEYPNEGTLMPEEGERMGSPLVLRPLRTNDGKTLSALVLLVSPEPSGLRYKFNNSSKVWPVPGGKKAFACPELTTYHNSPMKGLHPDGNAKWAFIAFLKKRSYSIATKAR